jgi:hypothetical protein
MRKKEVKMSLAAIADADHKHVAQRRLPSLASSSHSGARQPNTAFRVQTLATLTEA